MFLFSAIKGRIYFIEITRRIPFAVSVFCVYMTISTKPVEIPVIRIFSLRAFFISSIATVCMSVRFLSARGVIHGAGNINHQHRSSCLAGSCCCFVHVDFQVNLILVVTNFCSSLA